LPNTLYYHQTITRTIQLQAMANTNMDTNPTQDMDTNSDYFKIVSSVYIGSPDPLKIKSFNDHVNNKYCKAGYIPSGGINVTKSKSNHEFTLSQTLTKQSTYNVQYHLVIQSYSENKPDNYARFEYAVNLLSNIGYQPIGDMSVTPQYDYSTIIMAQAMYKLSAKPIDSLNWNQNDPMPKTSDCVE